MISKVQQRGVKATKDVVMKLLDGMNDCDGQKVLIVDLNPSRQARLKTFIHFFESTSKISKSRVQLSLPGSVSGPRQHGKCNVTTYLVKKDQANGTSTSWASTTMVMGIGWMPTRT